MDNLDDPGRSYSLDELHARTLLGDADQKIDIIADLLQEKTKEEILDLKVIVLLCDSLSCNYHIWRILKANLSYNLVEDEEDNKKVVALSEQDLFMIENAVLSKAFATVELTKLNYSLSLH